jgi:phosphoribosylformylglycinamidine (FGAM) synthase-like enzyme
MDIDLATLGLDATKALYSESTGRILITVSPQNKAKFEKNFKGFEELYQIGHIAHSNNLNINNTLKTNIKALEEAYKSPLAEY